MMSKIYALIFISFWGIFSFGQSKKKLNFQLQNEFIHVRKTYDSINEVHRANMDDIGYLQRRVGVLVEEIWERRRSEEVALTEISRKIGFLKELSYNADSIVTMSPLYLRQSQGKKAFNLEAHAEQYKSFALSPVVVDENISELKIKEQNEYYQRKIAEVDSINQKNSAVLSEEQKTMKKLTSLKNEYELAVKQYQDFINELYQIDYVLARKCIEENNKKVEAQRILDEKAAAAAAKKNKNKKPARFIPPVIVDEIPYPDEQLYYDQEGNMNVSSDYWDGDRDYAPPPVEEPQTNEPLIYDVVEEEAEFPGGRVAMNEYLKLNLRYPEIAEAMGIEGKCYLKFIISESGNISNVKVLKGVPDCKECDDEAVRVVKAMPNWIPGKIDGKAVNSYFTIPIKFPQL